MERTERRERTEHPERPNRTEHVERTDRTTPEERPERARGELGAVRADQRRSERKPRASSWCSRATLAHSPRWPRSCGGTERR
eukprot:4821475-Pleurochrysis_carterae.AAC.1